MASYCSYGISEFYYSALLEQSQKGHADQLGSLKDIISKLEALVAEKQAENIEFRSSAKAYKQRSKKLLEQVANCILLSSCHNLCMMIIG